MQNQTHHPDNPIGHCSTDAAEKATLDFKAPWEVFPDVPRFSIGWRMGDPEQFLEEWHASYNKLDKWERRAYRREHRAPIPLWTGFYSLESRNPAIICCGVILTVIVFIALFLLRVLFWRHHPNPIKLD